MWLLEPSVSWRAGLVERAAGMRHSGLRNWSMEFHGCSEACATCRTNKTQVACAMASCGRLDAFRG